jgi:site-specific recombinase XerD
MKKKSEVENFNEWYINKFLCTRDIYSPILHSENRSAKAKYMRIGETAKLLLENPTEDIQEIREKIALKYLISMRIALDYIGLAKLVVKEYKKQSLNT